MKEIYKKSIVKTFYEYSPMFTSIKILESIIVSFIGPLSIVFLRKFIDSIGVYNNKLVLHSNIFLWFALFCAMLIINNNLNFANNLIDIKLKEKIRQRFLENVIQKCIRIKYEYFEDPKTNNLLTRIGEHIDEKVIECFLLELSIITTMISMVSYFIILLEVSLIYSIIFLMLMIFIVFFQFKSMNIMNNMLYSQSKDERKLEYYSELLSNKNSLYELTIFNSSEYIRNKLTRLAHKILGERTKTTLRTKKYDVIVSLATFTWLFMSIIGLINSYVSNNISKGLFIAVITSMSMLMNLNEVLAFYMSDFVQKYSHIKYYKEFMQLEEEKDIITNNFKSKKVKISFEGVSFRYPNSDKLILNNLSFSFFSDQRISFVGENGCGKSTIVKLMFKLYEPTSGRILINNEDLSNISRKELTKIYSVVFQDYYNYEFTFREDIALYNIDKINKDEEILQIIKEKFNGLGINLNQNLGHMEDDGIDLSTGQWQQIAIARAYFKDSKIIILDEPTSALDAKTEYNLYNTFTKVLKNRGCVLISHRLASSKLCERIFVISNGKIIEEGSHEELMTKKGVYKEMFTSQKQWYE